MHPKTNLNSAIKCDAFENPKSDALRYFARYSCNPSGGYVKVFRNGSVVLTFGGGESEDCPDQSSLSVTHVPGVNTIRWTYFQNEQVERCGGHENSIHRRRDSATVPAALPCFQP